MAKNNKMPAIRFSGYTDAWEQRKFGDLFEYERPDAYIVKSDNYNNDFNMPVLTANKAFILGYTNEENSYNKPSIIFDDFTLDRKYVDFPYMLKSSAIKILTSKNQHNLRFLFERLNSTRFEVLGHARHYISVVQNTTTLCPSIDEEVCISNLLTKFDELITLHQRKLEKLKLTKKALLQKLFPKNGSNIPELRFKGFTNAWEQRKLKSIANTIVAGGDIDKTKIKEIGTYPVIANALTKEGIVGYYNDDYRIEAPAVTVTGRGDIGVAKARHQNFTPVVRLLSLTTAHDVDFIENAINNLKIVSESTGVPQLTVPQLSNYKIYITSIIEEQKIGVFISKLDNLITLHQRKLEMLKNVKKGLLQKMFV